MTFYFLYFFLSLFIILLLSLIYKEILFFWTKCFSNLWDFSNRQHTLTKKTLYHTEEIKFFLCHFMSAENVSQVVNHWHFLTLCQSFFLCLFIFQPSQQNNVFRFFFHMCLFLFYLFCENTQQINNKHTPELRQ